MITSALFTLGFALTAHHGSLDGTWKTGFAGDPQGFQVQQQLDFSGDEFVQGIRVKYMSPIGQPMGFTMHIYGNFTLGGAIPGIPGAVGLDETLHQLTQTVLNAEMADEYNEKKYCGLDTWEPGVEQDITGLKCEEDEEPFVDGDVNFDILSVDGSQLQTGLYPDDDDTIGTDAAHRPAALDPNLTYVRQ